MTLTFDYYFSFRSPCSYLSSPQVEELVAFSMRQLHVRSPTGFPGEPSRRTRPGDSVPN
jgi:2-hydroxychromene-2-carboxylate isomerase